MFKVPTYSQFLDVKRKKWQHRSCGVIALKMVLEYWEKTTPASDELIKLAVNHNAYLPKVGWRHRQLAQLAILFGLRGKNYDWSKLKSEAAQKKLTL